MKLSLQLNTGHSFIGKSFGKEVTQDEISEIVFQTGMVGYPESLTDPSYLNQILVLTYPLIGNYGIGEPNYDEFGIDKFFESSKIHIKALVVGEYNPKHSHWKGKKSLGEWLQEKGIIGISGVDTRELVKIIRQNFNTVGKISSHLPSRTDSADSKWISNINMSDIIDKTQASNVSFQINLFGKLCEGNKLIINSNPDLLNILVIDCGIKNSQLRGLLKHKVQLTVVNTEYRFLEEAQAGVYQGIFISNGPGDPRSSIQVVEQLEELFSLPDEKIIPVFGICYGHQLMGLAAGCKIGKMKYGNRGHNIPCNLIGTQKCYITSQNHGFEVVLPEENHNSKWTELFVNSNDNSNEGIINLEKPFFSVQFHPEARAGPKDTVFLFDIFIDRCQREFNVKG